MLWRHHYDDTVRSVVAEEARLDHEACAELRLELLVVEQTLAVAVVVLQE